MLEVTKNAPQMAIIQLGAAFKNFFAGRAQYPKFRKKGVHDRFSLTNDQFGIDGSRIRIPNLGWVRMRETLRFTGKIRKEGDYRPALQPASPRRSAPHREPGMTIYIL